MHRIKPAATEIYIAMVGVYGRSFFMDTPTPSHQNGVGMLEALAECYLLATVKVNEEVVFQTKFAL